MKFVLRFLVLFMALALSGGASAETDFGDSGEVDASVDAIQVLRIPSLATGQDIDCLVFLPGDLDKSQPVPALIVFPNSAADVALVDEQWSSGEFPENAGMIVLVPEIDSKLPEEIAFSLFSEIMFVANETYSLDPTRIYLWGVGAGAAHAFFAARCLPEKFAAVVDFNEALFLHGGLLDFAKLEPQFQIEAVRSDPSTYRKNLSQIGKVANDISVESVEAIEPSHWGRICAKLLKHEANATPKGASYRTDRLRFNKFSAFQIINLRKWSLPAGIHSETSSENGRLVCNTENVYILSISVPVGVEKIRLDEDSFEVEPGRSYTFQKRRRWREIDTPAVIVNRKHPDCAGPLADTLFTPFVFVVGTQGENERELKSWAEISARHLGLENIRIVTDEDVLEDEDLQRNYSLMCFGTANENLIAKRIRSDKKPGSKMDANHSDMVHTYLQPSPFAIDRYLVVNEPLGPVSMEGPVRLRWYADWSVYRSVSGEPLALGNFDEDWGAEDAPEEPWSFFR